MPEVAVAMPSHRTSRVELTDAEVKKLKIGQQATIKLTGKVMELEGSHKSEFVPEGGKAETFPGSVRLDISSASVQQSNAFTEMADEDDEE